ncbi:hypothetical protein CCMA1212_009699 [Trichoderma ghanense]|uniref:Uncharacterized protein n=1 Tax=Trichoderma ghanense TaxID=65468 RepID=A0ABY2GSH4_9HYPO
MNRLSALGGRLRTRTFVSRWINSRMHGSIQGSTASFLRLEVPSRREGAVVRDARGKIEYCGPTYQ